MAMWSFLRHRRVLDLTKAGIKPRDILARSAFEDAMAIVGKEDVLDLGLVRRRACRPQHVCCCEYRVAAPTFLANVEPSEAFSSPAASLFLSKDSMCACAARDI